MNSLNVKILNKLSKKLIQQYTKKDHTPIIKWGFTEMLGWFKSTNQCYIH